VTTIKRFAFALALTFFALLINTRAQTPQVSTVNVTPEEGRVRVAAVGGAFGLRVEVVDESGDTVFQADQVSDKGLDWAMTDTSGKRVSPGTYTVTASYTTPSGKVRKRIEQVLVIDERRASGNAAETSAATPNAPNPAAAVDGTGVVNRVPKFTDADSLTSSVITDVSGRVGIGTTAPAAGLRLEVNGATRLTTGGSGGFMQFGSPNTETGLTWSRTASPAARADIRFNGSYLTLAAGAGTGVPSNTGIVIDKAGKVGIGTSAPLFKLQVSGGNNVAVYAESAGSNAVIGQSSSPSFSAIRGVNSAGGYAGGFSGNVFVEGNLEMLTPGGSAYFDAAYRQMLNLYSTTYGIGVQAGTQYFRTNAHFGWYKGGAHSNTQLDPGGGTRLMYLDATGRLTVLANVCAANIPCSSDSRLKQNVASLNYGLDQLLRLRPVSWRWKTEPEGQLQMGLVAQEVEGVMPELVMREADASKPLGLNYMALLPVAVKAIQEQQQQIKQLQELVARQQARLNQVRRAVRGRAAKR
jgi:hypothetical protein